MRMRRVLLVLGVFAVVAVGGLLTGAARADGGHHRHRHHHDRHGCYSPPPCHIGGYGYGGGYGGYRAYYPSVGYGGYGHGGYGYRAYPSSRSSFYYQRPGFGLYLGY